MHKVGVFPGKFLPPHRGHLNAIIHAATQVDKLYVVVSERSRLTLKVCQDHNLRYMSGALRARWLSVELQGIDHIKVILLDESDIPEYPHGVKQWASRLHAIIPEHVDVMFTGEPEYEKTFGKYHPGTTYKFFDVNRKRWPISASTIRENPLKHWDYILGAARAHFTKRVLITGTESCGKSTLTKYLAKIFLTSWSEEVGRGYADQHVGGNENLLSETDFVLIAFNQFQQDEEALRTANRITFFDTDAVVTQYYARMLLGHSVYRVEDYVDPEKYDVVLMMAPTVAWVADGKRFNEAQEERDQLHNKLYAMYQDRDFDEIVVVADDTYESRLRTVIQLSEKLLE